MFGAGARRVGARRATRWLTRPADRLYLAAGRAPLAAEVGGVRLNGYLRHRSFLADAMRPRETYGELFSRSVRPGMTVIDGGAHVGLYTLLAGRALGNEGLVVAFEPDRYNLRALQLNVRRAGIANIVVVPKALSNAPGTSTFYEASSTIGSSLHPRPDSRRQTVETTSVDAELRGRAVAELVVKLNVEGAESDALDGMRETIDRAAEVTMFIEANPPLLDASGTDVAALIAGLESDGFEVFYVDLPTQEPVVLPRPLPKGHLLAARRR